MKKRMSQPHWLLQTKGLWISFVLGSLPMSFLVLTISAILGMVTGAITFRMHFGSLETPTVGIYDFQFLGSSDPDSALLTSAIFIVCATMLIWYLFLLKIGSRNERNQVLESPTTS